jgi:hypothetical protein
MHGSRAGDMRQPTVAGTDMAAHLVVDDEVVVGRGVSRGSRFFGPMLLCHASVLVLAALLTVAPINWQATGARGTTPPPPGKVPASHCTGLQRAEDCSDGHADPICGHPPNGDGCLWCDVGGVGSCVRWGESQFCSGEGGGGGYGYSGVEVEDYVLNGDLVYMPIIGVLTILITVVGASGSWKNSRPQFVIHAVLLPPLCVACAVCAVVGVVMGRHESEDCGHDDGFTDPALQQNICSRVLPYYISVVLFVLLGGAHCFAARLHYQGGTYRREVLLSASELQVLHSGGRRGGGGYAAASDGSTAASPPPPALEMAAMLTPPLVETMPATLVEAHAEIARLQQLLATTATATAR